MSKTVTRIVSILTDATADVLNLTKTRIKEDITVEIKGAEITDEGSLKKFKGRVSSTGEPIGLVQFATNVDSWQAGKPISVKIFRKRGAVKFRHAFIAKGSGMSLSKKTGDLKVHMWERETRSKRPFNPRINYAALPRHMRFPIRRLTTSRIQDIQAQPDFIGAVLHDVGKDALGGLQEEMDVVFQKV
ncbi:MAG: hypothetical protein AB1457_16280 [Chloroflexota bacterium]